MAMRSLPTARFDSMVRRKKPSSMEYPISAGNCSPVLPCNWAVYSSDRWSMWIGQCRAPLPA